MITKATRKIVNIDPDKCDGCGRCVPACAEGAIQIIDGKARLVSDELCDGLGDCLGECPRGAISIEQRPAGDFDPEAVRKRQEHNAGRGEDRHEHEGQGHHPPAGGCPGMAAHTFDRDKDEAADADAPSPSRLTHWPVQLALAPVEADIWRDADVLISADCVAYAMGDFHRRLLAGRTLAVGCPKLDDADAYFEKLTRIFAANEIKTVTVARMEVPCCGGLETVVGRALEAAGKSIPVNVVVVTAQGEIRDINGINLK